MKWHLLIAVILGIALGIGLRKIPKSPPSTLPAKQVQSTSNPKSSLKFSSSSSQQLEIRGDLTSDQIFSLSPGAIRNAETALWALSASSEELELHWQALIAEDEPDHQELKNFMALWVRRNFQSAFEAVQGRPHESLFHSTYAEVDRENALALAKEAGPSAYANALRTVATTAPDFAIELLDQVPPEKRYSVAHGIAHGLFKRDPEAAVDLADDRGVVIPDLVNLWAREDPARAFSYLLGKKSRHSYNVLETAYDANPDLTKKQIDSMPPGRLKSDMISGFTKLVAESDSEEALRMAETQADHTRFDSLQSIGGTSVATQPQIAVEAFEHLLTMSSEGRSLYGFPWHSDWIAQLMGTEPEKLFALTRDHPPEYQQQFLQIFADASVSKPRSWVESLPKSEEAELLASTWIQNNPQRSSKDLRANLELATGFQTEKIRSRTMTDAVRTWLSEDQAGLQEYLDSPSSTTEHLEIFQSLTEEKGK